MSTEPNPIIEQVRGLLMKLDGDDVADLTDLSDEWTMALCSGDAETIASCVDAATEIICWPLMPKGIETIVERTQ